MITTQISSPRGTTLDPGLRAGLLELQADDLGGALYRVERVMRASDAQVRNNLETVYALLADAKRRLELQAEEALS